MARISKEHINYFFEYGMDISTKTLYLGSGDSSDCDVDEVLAANIIKGLRILSSIRPDDPINIIVNSQGGDTQHGLAIYDAIRMVSTPVYVTVLGHCYSISAWILQAGRVRRMTPNSSMMIHHGAGRKDAFEREQDKRCTDILLSRIREKHPGFTEAKLDKLLLKDTYLFPEEALELGLIDEITHVTEAS